MTDRINRRYERPICPGDLEPLDSMLPAMREVVAMRATAREIVESARAAVQTYVEAVMGTELLRHRNPDAAKLIPHPMGQDDMDEYVEALYKAHQACYLVELPRLLHYRMELLDIIRGCRGISETFANLTSLLRLSRKISVRQHAVQRRLRHPWCFVGIVREAQLVPQAPHSDEPYWDDDDEPSAAPNQLDATREPQPEQGRSEATTGTTTPTE